MKAIVPFLLLVLCACAEERPPAPTTEQAGQLNEAEDLLNAAAEAEEGRQPGR